MNVHLAKRPMNVHTTDTPHTTSTRDPPSICLRFLRKVARFPIPTGCAECSDSAVSRPGACSHPPGTARAPSGNTCLIRLLVALLGGLVVADLDHLELVRGRHRRLGVGRLVRGRLDLARGLGRRLLLLLLLLLVGGDSLVGVGELLLDVLVLLVDRLSRVLEQVALPALRVRGDLRELLHRRLARLLVARLLILDAVCVLLHGRLPRDLEAAAALLLLLLPVRALLVGRALGRDPPRLRVRLHVRPGVVGRPDERRGGRLVLHARRLGRLESRVLRVHLELGARSVRCRVRGLRAVLLLLLLLLLLRLARLLNQRGRVLALGLQLRLGRLGRLGRFRRLGGRLLGLLGGLRLLLLLLLRLLGLGHRRSADQGLGALVRGRLLVTQHLGGVALLDAVRAAALALLLGAAHASS